MAVDVSQRIPAPAHNRTALERAVASADDAERSGRSRSGNHRPRLSLASLKGAPSVAFKQGVGSLRVPTERASDRRACAAASPPSSGLRSVASHAVDNDKADDDGTLLRYYQLKNCAFQSFPASTDGPAGSALRVAFVDSTIVGLPPEGFAVCTRSEEFGPKACGYEYGWTQQGEHSLFSIKGPSGASAADHEVILGVYHAAKPVACSSKEPDVRFRINGRSLVPPGELRFGEVRVVIAKEEALDAIYVLAPPPPLMLSYVHIHWNGSKSLPPIIELPHALIRRPPAFDANAYGSPAIWNAEDAEFSSMSWGKKAKNRSSYVPGAVVDVNSFMAFLHVRLDHDGQPICGGLAFPLVTMAVGSVSLGRTLEVLRRN